MFHQVSDATPAGNRGGDTLPGTGLSVNVTSSLVECCKSGCWVPAPPTFSFLLLTPDFPSRFSFSPLFHFFPPLSLSLSLFTSPSSFPSFSSFRFLLTSFSLPFPPTRSFLLSPAPHNAVTVTAGSAGVPAVHSGFGDRVPLGPPAVSPTVSPGVGVGAGAGHSRRGGGTAPLRPVRSAGPIRAVAAAGHSQSPLCRTRRSSLRVSQPSPAQPCSCPASPCAPRCCSASSCEPPPPSR